MTSLHQRTLWVSFSAMCLLLGGSFAQQASTPQSREAPAAASATVPHLIRFSGTVKNAQGQPRPGVVGVTFSLYKEQEGGAALWLETQNVAVDAQGQYVVLLGSTAAAGIPIDAFSANEARWLGVQPEGQPEQRVLLVSVPYALKAADAETVGGLPASAFVLAAPAANAGSGSPGSQSGTTGNTTATSASSAGGAVPNSVCGAGSCPVDTNAPGGTANFLPLFTDPTTVQNSVLSQAPCPFDASQTCVGITNTNPPTGLFTPSGSPTRVLDVNGEVRVGGGNIFLQRNLADLTGRRNWAIGTETFNVGDLSIFVSASNSTFPSLPVFTALSNGWMGVGVGTPHANLEVAGSGGGLLVDSPGTITGIGSGLTNLPAANLSGSVPSSALNGVNGSGLTNLNAANLNGTVSPANLPGNVAFVNAANAFSVPNTFSTNVGTALSAASADPNGAGAIIANTGGGDILDLTDGGNTVLRANTFGVEIETFLARITNDVSGTTLNTLVRLTNTETVATVPTTNPLAIGIIASGAGTSGKAEVVLAGVTNCLFDNATVVGDYVVISSTFVSASPVAGNCHDAGAKDPAGGIQVVGLVLQSIAAPGLAQIYEFGYQRRAVGSLGTLSLTGQSAAIPSTTLFTPLVGGLFRISAYIVPTAGTSCAAGFGCIGGIVTYKDDAQSQSLSFVQTTNGIGGFGQASAVIRAVPGQPIAFSTTYQAGTTFTYDLYVSVDRLQ